MNANAKEVTSTDSIEHFNSTPLTTASKRQASSVASSVYGAAPTPHECVQRAGFTNAGKVRHRWLSAVGDSMEHFSQPPRLATAAGRSIQTFVLLGPSAMYLAIILAIVVPIVASITIIALMFKYVPGLLEAFSSLCKRQEDDKTRDIDLEIGGGLMSPEPYHMTWPTPGSKAYSPFGDTPKAVTHPGLRVIERPPRSPRVMTSLVSPIKTGCSPPKRAIQDGGRTTLPQSPVVISLLSTAVAKRPFGRLV
ncbi:unnamed protein product [Phytophthora lilii]|uniref:Unnamed protein product n=1 Tax=Phytophthora lilii TaxID=2077276 RepID=A0A9W6TLF4_9STRA|nr:unnamed protein product [Phytophthora lilii]